MSHFLLSEEAISKWLSMYRILDATISPDLTVEVPGDVHLSSFSLKRFPIRFSKVHGSFLCERCTLETLEGSPQEVGKDFSCSDNNLGSLMGGPLVVGGDFRCSANKLVSLDHGPVRVGKNYACNGNRIRNLLGSPLEIPEQFNCSSNQLKSLVGGPKKVGGSYSCDHNPLETLNGLAEEIGINFISDFLGDERVSMLRKLIESGSTTTAHNIAKTCTELKFEVDAEKMRSAIKHELSENESRVTPKRRTVRI